MKANRICTKCENTFLVGKVDRTTGETACPLCGSQSIPYTYIPSPKGFTGGGTAVNRSAFGTDIFGKVHKARGGL